MITDYQHQLPHTLVIGTLTHRTAALQTNEDFSHLQLPAPLHKWFIMFMLMVMVSAGQERMIVW